MRNQVFILAGAIFCGVTPSALRQENQSPSPEQLIEKALPPGWTIADRKLGEIPFGHHWCEDYQGPKGTKLVLRGPKSAKYKFRDSIDSWITTENGKEALEVWLMPATYREGLRNTFCFHRPIQPTAVWKGHNLQLYARPSVHQSSDEVRQFKELLAKSAGVASPESPWNDPNQISWQSWQIDIKMQFTKKFIN